LRERASLLQERFVHHVVESYALKTYTGDFECTGGVELSDFVDILRGGVFTPGDGFFDDRLGCLSDIISERERKDVSAIKEQTSVDSSAHSFVARSSSLKAL
jgi:hypothetical protein